MREIKFRAWDKSKMLYRTLFDKNWYLTSKNDINGCHCLREIRQEDKNSLEIMQFTGFKDKNDIEIYELTELNNRYIVMYVLTGYVLYDILNKEFNYFEQMIYDGFMPEVTKEFCPLSENQKRHIDKYVQSSKAKKYC